MCCMRGRCACVWLVAVDMQDAGLLAAARSAEMQRCSNDARAAPAFPGACCGPGGRQPPAASPKMGGAARPSAPQRCFSAVCAALFGPASCTSDCLLCSQAHAHAWAAHSSQHTAGAGALSATEACDALASGESACCCAATAAVTRRAMRCPERPGRGADGEARRSGRRVGWES